MIFWLIFDESFHTINPEGGAKMTKNGSLRQIFFALAIFAWTTISSNVSGTNLSDIAGKWDGSIMLTGTELGISTDFSQDSLGNWAGTIDIPLQGAKGLPLTNISISDLAVAFKISNVPGEPIFDGTIEGGGNVISGDFTQGGQTFKFKLKRKDAAASEADSMALEATLGRLRLFADSARKIWKVPGLGIAIIKDGKIVLSEGFGYRSLKDSLKVTAQTLFAIGSSTKAFTTMALGMLVDSGLIDWDKPVRSYLPTFKMKDQFANERITPRDLVTHRSGLPRHDLMWYNSPLSRKELIDAIQYLEPNKDFRTEFQYQNLMFLTAGYLIEQVTGKSWEDNIRAAIFNLLEMNSSNFSVTESQKSADFALPYREEDSLIKEIPFRNITTMGPAGSINSNLEDMAKWVMLFLNQGKVGTAQLISQAQLTQMRTPHMAISQPPSSPERSAASYGLGWFLETYRGHERVFHGGNIDGFSALVAMLPQDNIGMIVLTNLDGTPAPSIIALYAADLLLGLEPVDWSGKVKTEMELAKEAQKKAGPQEPERKPGTKPSHKLADYAGIYENPGYGDFKIDFDGKNLSGVYNGIVVSLEHWHYDVFMAKAREVGDTKILVNFMLNIKGDIDRFSANLEPTVPELLFTRKPSAEMYDPRFLEQFTGAYDFSGQIVTIELRGRTTLTMSVAGQPTYELVPYKGNEFTLKGLTGFSVEFTLDRNGAVVGMVSKQPNGVFSAQKKK